MTKLLFPSPTISTPFYNKIKITYADDIASGRPCYYIEKKILKLLPYYSNTHSNASMGILMKDLISKTRKLIRTLFKVSDDYIVLFTGNGSTGAVNHLKNSINFKCRTNIYLTRYEHYSNYLPWFELTRHSKDIKVHIIEPNIPIVLDNDILNIITINNCSNVTGECIDISYYKKLRNTNTYLFLDMSCIAPYIDIDISDIDAIFMSGHKFFGGTGCPGILVARKSLFTLDCPYQPGGSCVKKADSHDIIYSNDLETRESAGTPNIIGIIKFGYVLKLKQKLLPHIKLRETQILNILTPWITQTISNYPKFKILGDYKNKQLPILSFSYGEYHPNLLVKLLNDLFGIQTRGGISCCGLLGEYYRSLGINGWCRVSLSWHMSNTTIYNILESIHLLFNNIDSLQNLYTFNKETNLWSYIDKK